MPKVFLTGSAESKGFHTGSGYLSSPARIKIRDKDNRLGEYPSVFRNNTYGTSGDRSNTPFQDKYAVRFGTSIKDSFEITNVQSSILTKQVNSNKWLVSSKDVKIKREFDPRSNFEISKGAVVLAGPSSKERWIRTKRKVYLPTVNFSLLIGPYGSTGGALSKFKLQLSAGKKSEVFTVEASITGTAGTWKTIKIRPENISTNASPQLFDAQGRIVPTQQQSILNDIAQGGNVGDTLIPSPAQSSRRPALKIKLDFTDFISTGYKEPFYIRFRQATILDDTQTIYAIGNIDIVSQDQNVKYPNLDVNDFATIYHRNQNIATPSFVKSLMSTGSSLPNISAGQKQPLNQQQLTPFNEKICIPAENDSFFAEGVPTEVTPGFNGSLFSKTFFDVNFNSAEDKDLLIGVTEKTPNVSYRTNAESRSTQNNGQMLLAYWNFDLNEWQKIGKPLVDNRGFASTHTQAADDTKKALSASCLGFGPAMPIASIVGTGSDNYEIYPREVLEHFYKPVSTFGFPFAAKYHATSSQTIRASDIGITKPTIFEKCSFDLSADFSIPSDNLSTNPVGAFAYKVYTFDPDRALYDPERKLSIYTPTFFILVQRESQRELGESKIAIPTPGFNTRVGEISEELPKSVPLVSGSHIHTLVTDTRELITYGQYSLIVTASQASAPNAGASFLQNGRNRLEESGITLDQVLNSGIVRDSFDVVKVNNSSLAETIKIKNKKVNFPVRIANQHTDILKLKMHDRGQSNSGDFIAVELENKMKSRGLNLDGASRALVNGFSSLEIKTDPKEKYKYINPTANVTKTNNVLLTQLHKKLESISPYLVHPDDRLIFGVQYPVCWDQTLLVGGIDSTPEDSERHLMKLGNTSIRIYGSQVKNGVEFHEGLNQSLTSDALHEAIGSEPVCDQFQLAQRFELTGSFHDQFMFTEGFKDTAGVTQLGNVLGSLIVTEETRHADFFKQREMIQASNPFSRLAGIPVSGIGYVSPGQVHSLLAELNLAIAVANIKSYVPQLIPFFRSADLSRIYKDSRLFNLNNRKETYGSYQNYEAIMKTVHPPPRADIARLGGSPKYYFNTKHYGHFSDFVRQGLDGAFVDDPTTTSDNLFTAPAVRIRFAEKRELEGDFDTKVFVQIRPSDVDNTAYTTFQSSNISSFATSSLPFNDSGANGTHNPAITNRIYSPDAVEVT